MTPGLFISGAGQLFLQRVRPAFGLQKAARFPLLVSQKRDAASSAATSSAVRHVPSFHMEAKGGGFSYNPLVKGEIEDGVVPIPSPASGHDGFAFYGMSGGDIFHEMMLRHNVDHLCMRPESEAVV
jgi:hypothetical protein